MEDDLGWRQSVIAALPLALALAGIVVVILGAVTLAVSRSIRQALRRFLYLLHNALGVDIGRRGLVYIALYAALPALAAAFARAWHKEGFVWFDFFVIFAAVAGATLALNLLQLSSNLKRIFGSASGRVFRDQRKAGTAAILKEINLCLSGHVPGRSLGNLISDLLDLIVLHVRDHRGSHKERSFDVRVLTRSQHAGDG